MEGLYKDLESFKLKVRKEYVGSAKKDEMYVIMNQDCENLSDTFMAALSDHFTNDLEVLKEAEYQGFDVYLTLLSLYNRAKKVYPEMEAGSVEGIKQGLNKATRDWSAMISFAVMRSMNITKLNGCKDPEKFRSLFSRWGLTVGRPKNPQDLTLFRVCASNPKRFIELTLIAEQQDRFTKIDGLCALFSNILGPSIMPRTKWGLEQFKLWTLWAQEFNKRINSNRNQEEMTSIEATSANLAKIQFEGGFSEIRRALIFREILNAVHNRGTESLRKRVFGDGSEIEVFYDIIKDVTKIDMTKSEFVEKYLYRRTSTTTEAQQARPQPLTHIPAVAAVEPKTPVRAKQPGPPPNTAGSPNVGVTPRAPSSQASNS